MDIKPLSDKAVDMYVGSKQTVNVLGEFFLIAYDVETDACDRPYAIASLVQIGGQWYEVAQVFSSDLCDGIDAELNRREYAEA